MLRSCLALAVVAAVASAVASVAVAVTVTGAQAGVRPQHKIAVAMRARSLLNFTEGSRNRNGRLDFTESTTIA